MTTRKPRAFESKPAVREAVPLITSLIGPSGGGKTFSALRLGSGMRKANGGKLFVIDTEARRALHYADDFDFEHVEFRAPFCPLDYLDAIDHCVEGGAGVIVIDSLSHEWEGEGGVLEQHDAILDDRCGNDWKKRAAMNFAAWVKPKAKHTRLKNSLLQRRVHFVLCFRAKEKMKPVRGKEPVQLGWQPIAGADLVYEATVSMILHPGANGVPTLVPEIAGEKQMVKCPAKLLPIFGKGKPLSEDMGEQLATWSDGVSVTKADPAAREKAADLVTAYGDCSTLDDHASLEDERRDLWSDPSITSDDKTAMKNASDDARSRLVAGGEGCPKCEMREGHAPSCPDAEPPEETGDVGSHG